MMSTDGPLANLHGPIGDHTQVRPVVDVNDLTPVDSDHIRQKLNQIKMKYKPGAVQDTEKKVPEDVQWDGDTNG